VRDEVASSKDSVHAICARHGVPWQAFYKHARREGWPLRQRARRGFSSLQAIERLREVVIRHLDELKATGPFRPASKSDATRLAHMCAQTLSRLDALEKKERDERNAARRQKRAVIDERRKELARRIMALGRQYKLVDGKLVVRQRGPDGEEIDRQSTDGMA
jgi:hypothetical protein